MDLTDQLVLYEIVSLLQEAMVRASVKYSHQLELGLVSLMREVEVGQGAKNIFFKIID